MALTWDFPDPDEDDEDGVADVHLTPEGNFALSDGDVSVKQRLLQRLRFHRGESFLYNRRGVPYLEELIQRPASIGLISVVLAEEGIDVDGILNISEANAVINPSTRRMTWTGKATTETGNTIPVGVEG